MSRKLDPNSSSQRWADGSRALCEESEETENTSREICLSTIPDSQIPDDSDEELYDNVPLTGERNTKSEIIKDENLANAVDSDDSDNSRSSVSILKRANSLAVDVAEKVLDSIDRTHLVKGTHIHVRNGKIHLCSMSPFEFHHTDGLIDDREKIIRTFLRTMEILPFDRIFDLFQKDGQLMYEPLRRKFKKKYATDLFNIASFQKFSYDCLTLDDCEKLRMHYMMMFNISPCKCKSKNCFNFNYFVPRNA
ncbi:hypothetical protein [Aeromonas sobria]|uniref:hypothetical protein n=1 Tax=Aeromonas sobria TaxID=646 RepID=UPI003F2D83E4